MNERTYIMIKPSGVERGLVGEIIKRFEQKGLRPVGGFEYKSEWDEEVEEFEAEEDSDE